MNRLGEVAAGLRLELAVSRRSPSQFLVLLTAPLFSVIFLSLVLHNGSSAVVNAVLGPGLIGLWAISLDVAGSVLSDDRWAGRLEMMLGSPASVSAVVVGRILAVTLAGMLTFVESWLVATLAIGLDVPLRDPLAFAVTLVATGLATAGTAALLASAFMVSRSLHVFQNSMSYPLYILGGVVVPVATLPDWLHPISRLVYLSWSADLLRDTVAGTTPAAAEFAGRLLAILGLGALALAAAFVLTRRITTELRRNATAALA